MAREARITGRIVDGLLDVTLDAIVAAMQGWPDGLVTVDVKPARRPRTLPQNKAWWALVVAPLAEHLGYDHHEQDALHYALVTKCYGEHWDDRVKANVPNVQSSKLTTAQFAELTDWAVRFAAQEWGIVLTLPSEREP